MRGRRTRATRARIERTVSECKAVAALLVSILMKRLYLVVLPTGGLSLNAPIKHTVRTPIKAFRPWEYINVIITELIKMLSL